MRRQLILTLTSLLLPLTLYAADTSQEARNWLERMAHAVHSLNYDGTFIYHTDGAMQSLRIVHGVNAQGVRERLYSLNGPMREVIRDNDQVTCMLPDEQSVRVDRNLPTRPFPITLPTALEQLAKHYQLILGGHDRVADLDAVKVEIRPRDRYRYGYSMWIDTDSALLLRSELNDEDDQPIEQLIFTELRVHPQFPRKLLEPQSEGKARRMIEHNESGDTSATDNTEWKVEALPPGFSQTVHRRHFMPSVDAPVEHLVFSDGLASVSVFIESKAEQGTGEYRQARRGAVNTYTRYFDGYRATVVGEVPPDTVRLIAGSLSRR